MKGFIYIAGSFETVNRSVCGRGQSWVDNDPHFWTSPPTWGICRPDLRKRVSRGDYVFFVLPKNGRHPQMIFGYLKVKEKITHQTAYHRPFLRTKRMSNRMPNGNVIVNHDGSYNRFDGGAHKRNFYKIRQEYVVGDSRKSKLLTAAEIAAKAPRFISMLSSIFPGKTGTFAIDFISRKGQELNSNQASQLLCWL
jgi:hypothetical protein